MPVSIKGRIILEILEGMVYLTDKHVIHKDLKPENILVDKDFHIKVFCTLRPMIMGQYEYTVMIIEARFPCAL